MPRTLLKVFGGGGWWWCWVMVVVGGGGGGGGLESDFSVHLWSKALA